MAVDDLTAPLKAKTKQRKERTGPRLSALLGRMPALKLGVIAPVLLVALVFAAAAYVRFAGDPRGGEPVAVIALDEGTAVKPDPTEDMKGSQDTQESMVAAQEPDTEEDVDVIDTDGGAKVIIIRPEETIREASLPPVPDNRLVERTASGLLPRRGDDGAVPSTVYARQHVFSAQTTAGDKPRIAILVNGMGLNSTQTTEAIRQMPADVSLAFAPYADNLQQWVSGARQDGHEVVLQIPMEPFDYPDNDPGPHTLLTSLTPKENLDRLHWSMARMVGYVGLTNYMGARFSASREVLRPALLEMKKRGLLFIDDGTSPRSLAAEIAGEIGMPARRADIVLDAIPAPDAITAAIERLEVKAFQDGVALGVISALPVSIKTVSEWLQKLDNRGIELIPVSASTKAVAEG